MDNPTAVNNYGFISFISNLVPVLSFSPITLMDPPLQ